MKHQKYFPAVTIFVRIALVLGLIGMPSSGWGQEQQSVGKSFPPYFGEYHWSPTENKLIYWQINSTVSGPEGSPYDLFLFDVDSGFRQQLTTQGELWRAEFSSDGSLVQYWWNGQPYQMNLSDLLIGQVDTLAPVAKGVFSPDGKRLLYVTSTGDLRLRSLVTKEEQLFGQNSTLLEMGLPFPEWSPDGQYVVWLTREALVKYTINAATIVQQQSQALPFITERAYSPSVRFIDWTQSGEFILAFEQPYWQRLMLHDKYSYEHSMVVEALNGELFVNNLAEGIRIQLTYNEKTLSAQFESEVKSVNSSQMSNVADSFDYPVNPPNADGYNKTAGWEWLQWTGSVYHPGEDWNKNCGGDCDKGELAYAVANGKVIKTGNFPVWGNIVLIEHTLPDGNTVWSQYGHLNEIKVSDGEKVQRGDKIGTIGKGDKERYYAHLHFEIRTKYRAADSWVSNWTKDKIQEYYTEPSTFINNRRSISTINRAPSRPSLHSPNNGSVMQDGRAPTLCWERANDPDQDRVEYHVEVFQSVRNPSKTLNDLCWRFNELDGEYSNYQWRVKARDNRGAESEWSEVRNFEIKPENLYPTISFNTANGNSSGEINSRDQSWTFTGAAGDPEGRLNRVEFKCEGDSCNATQNIGNNGNWSFQRGGLTGRNRIWFTACDDRQCVDSRVVTLRVDLAPPVTTADANGQSNPSGWFSGPVEVKLRAQDGATGSASVGVREIRYRVDNGDWQSSSGDSKSVTINTDGAHTIEYYAIDHLDNQEAPTKRIAFQIDATPPSAPGTATETHGVGNDQWQKSVGAPEFTWGAASDSTSGLQHYELYFGPDANSDQIQTFVAANADRRWTPLPNGVRTGVYYLRARARDLAGNYSTWNTLFTFRYDVTPPGNPTAATHAANLPSGSWQRTSATADFTWTPPSDEGSGVKGYYVYWGDQPEGKDESPGAFRTSAAYGAAGPLCAAGQSCTGYLRVRSVDYVDNIAGDWSTLFTLRYDGAAPTLDFTINGGVTQTAQTLVSLNLNATDQGSGVRDARSFAGNGWSPWEPYQTERIETIPAIGRQSWPVYVQVRDAVGWESAVISKSVYFEVNRPQPKSANFWLFTGMVNGGNGSHASANYQGRSSIGQSVDAAPIASPNYILRGGYQTASQALPLQVPEHDEFTFINGVFASGIVNDTMQSAQYRLASSIGQMGLPANQTTLSSAGYQLQPGFLAAVPARQSSPTPPPTPTPGPTPTPVPPQGCEFATLSINQGVLFTNTPNVTLDLCGPNAAEMKVSNDGSFANAPWEPYRTSKGWTLTTLGQNVIARLVQARFKDSDGLTHHYAVDDIIYDPTAPRGAVAVNDPVPAALLSQLLATEITQAAAGQATAAMESFTVGDVTYLRRLGNRVFDTPVPLLSTVNAAGLDVYLIAQDDNSGLAQMQLGENANGDGAGWQAYDGLVQWTPSGGDGEKQLHARFRDSAGNASGVYSATVVIDSQPPLGGINIIQEIIGANTVNLQLYLAAEDNLSSISSVRLSHDPAFVDAPWQPFVAEMQWPIQVGANENEKTIYVQFRDAAGNVSQAYSDTVLIDRQPPVMYVEVATGDNLTRPVNLYAYDEFSALTTMRLSNDPLLIEAVVTLPYSDTVTWTFDERRVVWVQVDDGAGNRSDPYPAYAAMPGDAPDPEPVDQRVYLPLINR